MSGSRPALGHRLTLEAFDPEPDGGGGVEGEWRTVGWHWVELTGVAGGASSGGGRVTHRATLRWLDWSDPLRPDASMRMREGKRVFQVRGVAEADPHRRYLTCWLEESATR